MFTRRSGIELMGVKFFGQFLIDCGEVDAGHVREALNFMDVENPAIGQIAIAQGFMQSMDVMRVNAEQRIRDASFGDLAVEMGLLANDQLVEILQRQRSRRLPIGQALVRLGYVENDRLGVLLDAYKADQAQFDTSEIALPDGLASHRVTRYVLELLPRFMMRVARIQAKVGEIHVVDDQIPKFAEVRVSIPVRGARGLEVALVSDFEFAEALARASSGLDSSELDAEMVADGVGEFLNVLCGNAGSAMAKDGHRVELGPPDYEAELCDGWIVDLAVGVGRASVVLSTF
jgi:CheY-specific phosphatase CheX